MKKLKLFFALFAMLALGVGNAWGAEAKFGTDWNSVFGTSYSGSITGVKANQLTLSGTVNSVSLVATNGTSTNGYVKNSDWRLYNGYTLTLTAPANHNITAISAKKGGKAIAGISTTVGDLSIPSGGATMSWTGSSNQVVFTVTTTMGFSEITVTYSEGSGSTPTPDPTPDPEPEPDPTPDPGTGGELVGEQTATYVVSTATAVTTSGIVPDGSSASLSGTGSLSSGFIQCTNGKNHTLTLKGYAGYKIKSISIHVKSNSSKGTGSFSVVAGSTTIASIAESAFNTANWNGSWNNSGVDKVLTMTNDSYEIQSGEDVKLTINCKSGGSNYNSLYIKSYTIVYESTSTGGETPEPETPATELTNEQFAWSAATAEATMGASNTFPTLTNTLPVSVTYESSNTAAATIAADGTITLVDPGTTTISAKFAGGEVSGTTYAPKTVTYALTVLKAPATPTDNVYVKVTSTAGITDGEYLIVYEAGNVAFNGALEALDAVGNTLEVTINNNTIAGTNYIDAATFTIDVTNGTILSASGKYIGKTANSNGLDVKTTAMTNTFAIDANGNAVITGNTAALRYNKTADQKRFRYYKDGGGSQEKIALYKKASKHTVTIADCTNGSVSAKMGETALATNDQVLSGIQITLNNTPATGYKLATYDVYKTGDNTTKVTVTDDTFIMPEFDVTISATFVPAKTLTSIEITSAATQTTFWQGEIFNYTGLEVTAHFDGAANEVVTPTVTGSTATAGTQTVTVSYTEGTTTKTATYTVTVKDIPNTKETAYSVADAFDIIDKLETASGVFISGIISQVDSYNSTYKSITYWISADGTTTKQLQVYSGKGLESADFTAVTDVAKGAQVIVCGNLKKHNTTYEFDYNNYLAAYTAPTKAEPGIAYETTEYTANVNEAFTAPTLTNPNDLTVTYKSSDETLATVNATTGEVTILNKTGKVTITATFAGNETYLYGTASYNITISDPSLLEATFDATVDLGNTERGEGEIRKSPITFACTDGILGNSSEYRLYQNATISFTAENGYAITKVVITSTASGTSQYGPSHLSTENGTYSVSDKTGTWVGEAQTVTFTATAQSRAKLITVYYKTDNRQDAGLVWSTENVSITLGDAFTPPTLSNPKGLTLTCTSDNENLATVTNAGVVTLKSGVTGKATITAKFDGNSDYKDATVTCIITVNPKTETVVILAKYGDQWYALKNAEETAGKVLAALEVTYFNGTLYNVEEADKATIEWQRAAVTDGIIFKNGENYIYGTAGSTDLKLSTTECTWTLDGSTYKIGNRTFIYRAQANGFKNYNATTTPGTDDYSALPVVTAPVYVNLNTSSVKTVEKGIFSVADGKFVQFSTGNLQYEVKTNTWSFASKQYEVIGGEAYDPTNPTNTNYGMNEPGYTGKLDLFGWSSDGKFGVNPSNTDANYEEAFADWGNLVNEEGWYTLTKDEMNYILNRKKDGKKLWALATVCGMNGLILLPDNWNTSTTLEYGYVPADWNYTKNQFDDAAWANLEAAGAVFLPEGGTRVGGHGNKEQGGGPAEFDAHYDYFHVDNVGEMGYYWLNTQDTRTGFENCASYLILPGWSEGATDANEDDICLQPQVWSREKRRGNSVRLVKAIEPDYTREVRQGYYGTICLENGGQMIGASLFELSYYKEAQGLLYMEETADATMVAGNPYIFLPNERATKDSLYVFCDETTAAAKTVNGLVGSYIRKELAVDDYILKDNKISKVVGRDVFVGANKAYIKLGDVSKNEPAPVPGRRRVAIGQAPQVATGMESVDASAQPVKMIIDGQLYILRGEKMYDAQGKLVK